MTLKKIMLAAALMAALEAPSDASDVYPWPTNWSFGGIASWSQPRIASGAALPADADGDAGDLFILVDGASQTWYRHDGASFTSMTGSGGGGGTSDHSALDNLAYADAGHTGFASTTTVTNHIDDTTDPHGSAMTVTGSVTVGNGTSDATITRTATSTLTLASYTVIVPTAATPTATIATGTLWYDSNANKLKCYSGSAWNALW